MASPQNIRRAVLAAAVTSVTIAGTLYGAGLKTNEEIVEVSSNTFTPNQAASMSIWGFRRSPWLVTGLWLI